MGEDGEGEQPFPQVLHPYGHLFCWAQSQEEAQAVPRPITTSEEGGIIIINVIIEHTEEQRGMTVTMGSPSPMGTQSQRMTPQG